MDVKFNINKIHGDLIGTYGESQILESANSEFGQYFELKITKGNKTIKAVIEKSAIQNPNFQWIYYSNPLDVDSAKVQRESNIYNFCQHIDDIFEKSRFSEEYIKQLDVK